VSIRLPPVRRLRQERLSWGGIASQDGPADGSALGSISGNPLHELDVLLLGGPIYLLSGLHGIENIAEDGVRIHGLFLSR